MTAPVVDLRALERCDVRRDPFDWALLRDCFGDPRTAAELAADFPATGYTLRTADAGTGGKGYSTHNLTLADRGVPGAAVGRLAPRWRDLVDTLLGDDYRARLGDVMDVDLDGCTAHLRAVRYAQQGWIDPHTDRADKAVTQIWYFNPHWRPEWAGALRVLRSPDPQDVAAEVGPTLGTSVLMRPSARSWHCVTPVAPGAPDRLTLLLHFVRPEAGGR
ncbi:2OG-Fe(II) oxygenase [Streptacidiphilus neutrinimicus]|uniref:2OG-Fe(II) oxygenase n=1 Tax=Streptacidiphilus neutrinimicus TaxID=105420 RepID=UPI00069376E5|nr:2OG-Fe(II) oxygenase [Streptacidiphilus neutrinimicus]